MGDKVVELLQGLLQLANRRSRDGRLMIISTELLGCDDRRSRCRTYLLDGTELLPNASKGEVHFFVTPLPLLTGIVALVHTMYRHPGVA